MAIKNSLTQIPQEYLFASGGEGRALAVAPDGSIYVAGWAYRSVELQAASGGIDVFLSKLSFNASTVAYSLAWTRMLGGGGNDQVMDMAVDGSGNVFLAGATAAGLSGQAALGGGDIFVARYSSAGALQWSRAVASTAAYDGAVAINLGPDGNLYLAATSAGTPTGATALNAGARDLVLAAVRPSDGVTSWVRLLGSSATDEARASAVAPDGSIYVAGHTLGALGGQTSQGGQDVFIAKYSASGTLQWVRQMGTASADSAYQLVLSSDGHVYLSGLAGAGSFNGQTVSGSSDVFLTKYTSAGAQVWTRVLAGGSVLPHAAAAGPDGSVYLAGSTARMLDDESLRGGMDIFVMRYLADGTVSGIDLLGAGFTDNGYALHATGDATLYLTGQKSSSASVSSTLLARYAPDPNTAPEAPAAANPAITLNEDRVFAGQLVATDADGDALTYVKVASPVNGAWNLTAATGAFTYTPAANFSGTDSLSFRAVDGEGASSATVTLSITVLPVNDAPVAQDQSAATAEDTPLTQSLVATDIDSSALSFSLVSQALQGVVTLASNGSYTYTPKAHYAGADSFSYKVNDGASDSNVATVRMTVSPVNDAPVALAQSLKSQADGSATGLLQGTDVEGSALSFAKASEPQHGSVSLNSATGSFSYAPGPSFKGSDSFGFKVSDGQLESAVATVQITAPDSTPPSVTWSDTTPGVATGAVQYRLVFSEPVSSLAASALSVAGGTLGNFQAVSGTEYSFQVTPTPGGAGAARVSLAAGQVSDAAGNANLASSSDPQLYLTGKAVLPGTLDLKTGLYTGANWSLLNARSHGGSTYYVASPTSSSSGFVSASSIQYGKTIGAYNLTLASSSDLTGLFRDAGVSGSSSGNWRTNGGWPSVHYWLNSSSGTPAMYLSTGGWNPGYVFGSGYVETGRYDAYQIFKVSVNTTVAAFASVTSLTEQASEGSVLTVLRTGSTASALQVKLNLSGTAALGSDFRLEGDVQLLSGTPYAVLAAGKDHAVVRILGLRDAVSEGQETVSVALDTSSLNYAVAGAALSLTLQESGPVGSVSLSGLARQGEVLSAAHQLTDLEGLPTSGPGAVRYQWQADGVNIEGATAATFTLGQPEVGKRITVVALYTDGAGAQESLASAATAAVTNVNDGPVGSLRVTGEALQGQELVAQVEFTDADGLGSLRYTWLADGQALAGATGARLLLTEALVGRKLGVRVDYTDRLGSAESVSSAEREPVVNLNDAPQGELRIAGSFRQGERLQASAELSDADGLGTVSLQWWADGQPITGATGAALDLGQDLVGKTVSARASYTDGRGAQEVVSSLAAVVANVNDAPVGQVQVIGEAVAGQTLRAQATLSDADGLGELSYQWQANGVALAGATAQTLSLGQEHLGQSLRVVLSYTDLLGSPEQLRSAATPVVTDGTRDALQPSWTRSGQGAGSQATAVKAAADGAVYVVGNNNGNSDAYVQKYDAAGTLLWSRALASSASDSLQSAAVAPDGGVYVLGSTAGVLQGQTPLGLSDVFLTRLSAAGDLLWTRLYGSAQADQAGGLAIDPQGAVYLSGRIGSGADGQAYAGNGDGFVMKLDAEGGKLWTRLVGGLGADRLSDLALGPDGSVVAAGAAGAAVDGQAYAGGSLDVLLVSFDAAGSKLWTRMLGSEGVDFASGVDASADGIYLAGAAGGPIAGQAFLGGTLGFGDGLLARFDGGGQLQWARLAGTDQADLLEDVALGPDGAVYAYGWTQGALVDQASRGQGDGLLLKFQPGGATAWSRLVGGSGNDDGNALAVAADGSVYLAGNVQDSGSSLSRMAAQTAPSLTWTARSASVREGQTIGFDLLAPGMAAGTALDYIVRGVSAQDLLGLPQRLRVDEQGRGSLSFALAADGRTEGLETLSVHVAGLQASVSVEDSSTNTSPQARLLLAGPAAQGQALRVFHEISDGNGVGALSYQWLANGNPVAQATGNLFYPGAQQVGQALSVRLSYVDGQGNAEVLTSAATPAVAALAASTSFSGDGLSRVGVAAPQLYEMVLDLDLLPDGKWLVGSAAYLDSGSSDFALMRLQRDGAADPAFGSGLPLVEDFFGPGALDFARTVPLPDGKLLLAAAQAGSLVLSRRLADGSPDNTFASGGATLRTTLPEAWSLAGGDSAVLQADGKLLLLLGDAQGRLAVGRWLANGALDASWSGDGLAPFSSTERTEAVAMQWQADGKLVLAGARRNADLSQDALLWRLNPDGSLDAGFGTSGMLQFTGENAMDAVTDLALQGDGKIVIGGRVGSLWTVARLLADGRADASFNSRSLWNLSTAEGRVEALELDAAGRIVVARNQGENIGLARLMANGEVDLGFGRSGLSTIDAGRQEQVAALALQADGKIAVAGQTHGQGGSDLFFARLSASGQLDASPLGGVTLTGRAEQGQTLLAQASGSSQGRTLSYLWLADGLPVAGATSAQLALTQALVGKAISAQISYIDANRQVEAVRSEATAPVQNVNEVPVAASSVWTGAEDAVLTGRLSATDGDGDPLVYALVSAPERGRLQLSADGVWSYEPELHFSGEQSFSFTVGDGLLTSAVTTARLVLSPVNDAPVAESADLEVEEDQMLSGSLRARDVDGDAVLFVRSQLPAHGRLVIQAETGAFTYTPSTHFNGTDSFSYAVTDGSLLSERVTVTVTVRPVNDAPNGQPVILGDARLGQALSVQGSVTDVDGIVQSGPGALSLQWLADGLPVAGATGPSFEPGWAQLGQALSVRLSYVDQAGTQESVLSQPTGPVTSNRAGMLWIAPQSLATREAGEELPLRVLVVLTRPPQAEVEALLSIADATEGRFADGTAELALKFSTQNWNLPQLVEVFGVDDALVDGDVGYSLSLRMQSSDLDYAGLRSGVGQELPDLQLLNRDDDAPVLWRGGEGDEVFAGGPGADDLYGNAGRDELAGGAGNDRMYGGYENDTLRGGAGEDEIEGEQGDDQLHGEDGDDSLLGGTGRDSLYGGAGNDMLDGDKDADFMDGGTGADIYYVDNPGDVVQDSGKEGERDLVFIASYLGSSFMLGAGVEDISLGEGAGSLAIVGNAAANLIEGNSANNVLSGGAGEDTLQSGAGDDRVDAGEGDDLIVGGSGAGNDTYIGGAGQDLVRYTSAVDAIVVNLLQGLASGRDIGQDQLTQIEHLIGGQGGDTLVGDAQANRIDGYLGNDSLTGGAGNDTLDGGEGQDTAVYALSSSQYEITIADGGYRLSARAGEEGTDLLRNIESLRFADGTLAVADVLLAGAQMPRGAQFWKNAAHEPQAANTSAAVNLTDAIAVLKMVVGLGINAGNAPTTAYQAVAADYNRDGSVGLPDAIGILRKIVGMTAPQPGWIYLDPAKLPASLSPADLLAPGPWSAQARATPVLNGSELVFEPGAHGVKMVGVLTGDVDGSWLPA